MQSTFIDKFTRSFFWFGFCVFLGASIPHIAAFYRHFDPNATPGSIQDITDWTIGYLIAIVIDVTDVLVSIAVLKEINRGTPKRKLIGYWAFIVFVMTLSWLVNWQYDIVYQTNSFAKAENIAIFGVLVGSVNPVIGSAFQLLLLVYTAMAHKFAEKPVQKTAEQLRKEADELEQVAMQQARIDAVKKMQNDNKVGGIIDTIGQAKERAKQLFSNAPSTDQVFTPDALNEDENLHEGRTTDPLKDDNVELAMEDVFTPETPHNQTPEYTPLPVDSEQDYRTEEIPRVNMERTPRRTANTTHTKQDRIRKVLDQHPDATLSVIAKQAKVSRGYASQIRKELANTQ